MFFFILPVGVDYRARRYPVVTFTLIGICVLVYLVTTALEQSDSSGVEVWVIENLWLTPAESHWWNYLTSQFVHAGFFHLAGNMVYLFLFGACVEDLIGRIRFTLFYILSGVAAAFAHIAVSPNHFASDIPLGGASGAISGCIGGFLLLLARTKVEFKWVVFFWFRVWTGDFFVPAWAVISFYFVKDLVSMVLTAIAGAEGGGVAFAAHVGGTLFGIGLMSLEKLRRKYLPPSPEEIEEPAAPAAKPVVRIRARPARAPVPAAITEAPTIYLYADGFQSGPFTAAQIQQLFARHNISADALYWQAGMEGWRSAEELREPGTG